MARFHRPSLLLGPFVAGSCALHSRYSTSSLLDTGSKRRSSNDDPGTLLRPAGSTVHAARDQATRSRDDLRSMLHQCCDRMDHCEPRVRALLPEPPIQRRARILAAGDEAVAGPLHGLLLGVKDIIAAEGFSTRCGSAVPPEVHRLPLEAEVVRRLRDAGMIVAGKTVTTEFAAGDAGPTANPWNPLHTPGGSSSGSAAAVAAGEVHVALGTQTTGSVGRPATFCGVCGYKPSYGRISSEGVAIYSPSVDTVGLFTADAAGMALVAATAVGDWNPEKIEGLKRLPVLGVPSGAYLRKFDKESLHAFYHALLDLQSLGVSVRQVDGVLEDIDRVEARHIAMISFEWANSLRTQWTEYASLFRSKSAMWMVHGLAQPAEKVSEGRAGRSMLRSEFEKAMDHAKIDLWVTPGAIQTPAPRLLEHTGLTTAQLPWTHAGMPTLALPAGTVGSDSPLPFGLQLAARFGADEALLHWGMQLEALGIADTHRHVI